MIKIRLGEKEYNVQEAKTTEEMQKGLMGVKELPQDEGMIFYFDQPQLVEMWMRDTLIPLDIIYINEDQEVTAVEQGQPNDDTLLGHEDTMYVVEVNANSGIQVGDTLEFEGDENKKIVMQVLAPDGTSQMDLVGGERIVSRKETKVLIRKAFKAYKSQEDKDYKSLGKYMFKVLNKQDSREPEYVKSPN